MDTGAAIVERVIDREGGWKLTDRPSDAGGLTYGGMTWATFAAWRKRTGRPAVSAADFAAAAASRTRRPALRAEIRRAYADEFVSPFDGLPAPLRELAADVAVHGGRRLGVRVLQRGLRGAGFTPLAVDGRMGPETRGRADDAERAGAVPAVVEEATWARLRACGRIVQRRPADLPNLVGWINRAQRCKADVLAG